MSTVDLSLLSHQFISTLQGSLTPEICNPKTCIAWSMFSSDINAYVNPHLYTGWQKLYKVPIRILSSLISVPYHIFLFVIYLPSSPLGWGDYCKQLLIIIGRDLEEALGCLLIILPMCEKYGYYFCENALFQKMCLFESDNEQKKTKFLCALTKMLCSRNIPLKNISSLVNVVLVEGIVSENAKSFLSDEARSIFSLLANKKDLKNSIEEFKSILIEAIPTSERRKEFITKLPKALSQESCGEEVLKFMIKTIYDKNLLDLNCKEGWRVPWEQIPNLQQLDVSLMKTIIAEILKGTDKSKVFAVFADSLLCTENVPKTIVYMLVDSLLKDEELLKKESWVENCIGKFFEHGDVNRLSELWKSKHREFYFSILTKKIKENIKDGNLVCLPDLTNDLYNYYIQIGDKEICNALTKKLSPQEQDEIIFRFLQKKIPKAELPIEEGSLEFRLLDAITSEVENCMETEKVNNLIVEAEKNKTKIHYFEYFVALIKFRLSESNAVNKSLYKALHQYSLSLNEESYLVQKIERECKRQQFNTDFDWFRKELVKWEEEFSEHPKYSIIKQFSKLVESLENAHNEKDLSVDVWTPVSVTITEILNFYIIEKLPTEDFGILTIWIEDIAHFRHDQVNVCSEEDKKKIETSIFLYRQNFYKPLYKYAIKYNLEEFLERCDLEEYEKIAIHIDIASSLYSTEKFWSELKNYLILIGEQEIVFENLPKLQDLIKKYENLSSLKTIEIEGQKFVLKKVLEKFFIEQFNILLLQVWKLLGGKNELPADPEFGALCNKFCETTKLENFDKKNFKLIASTLSFNCIKLLETLKLIGKKILPLEKFELPKLDASHQNIPEVGLSTLLKELKSDEISNNK